MLKDTSIVIPTKGRLGNQITLENLPVELRGNITLLVDYEEFNDHQWEYAERCNVERLHKDIKGIAAVRQYAVEICNKQYLYLIDDDMVFFKRKPGTIKLKQMNSDEIISMFELLNDTMCFDEFMLVGLSARQGNNHVEEEFMDVTRQMNFHGIDVERFRKSKLRFDGSEVMEDFNLLLDMFTRGIPNRVFYKYCWNQKGSGADGGCSTYRTAELQKECALKLKEKYPDYVTVVEKNSKTGWKGLETRTDVRVQWKKAYNDGVEL